MKNRYPIMGRWFLPALAATTLLTLTCAGCTNREPRPPAPNEIGRATYGYPVQRIRDTAENVTCYVLDGYRGISCVTAR